jgi:hypothetical protein
VTTALIIAIILAVCVVFALGVYHGQHHAREQRDALDELGKQIESDVARKRAPGYRVGYHQGRLDERVGAPVYDHERSGL